MGIFPPLSALTLLALVAPGAVWPRFESTVAPYTILQPPSFAHRVSDKADVFAPRSTGFGVSVSISALPGRSFENEQRHLRVLGGTHIHPSTHLRIARRSVPVFLARFTGPFTTWTMEQAGFRACGLSWTLTMSYNPPHRTYRRILLRMLRSFHLTCTDG